MDCPDKRLTTGHPGLLSLDIDMTTMVHSLDNTASEIVAYQRDSTVQRKDLAQKTKDFRKLDDATKLTEIRGLLKGSPSFFPPRNQEDHSAGCSMRSRRELTSLVE